MPLLGSVNAGIYRNQEPIPWPGQQTAQSGQPPRADTPLMRLGLEQQKEQQINAIFQKHGTDYDAAVEEVMGIDHEKGQQLAGLLADGRKKGAEQHKAETESSLKNLEMVGHGIEMAIQDPTQYPKLLEFVSKQPGGSEYLKFAPDPADPELVPKLKALLPAVLGPKDFLKVTADAAQDYIDGDKQLAAAKTLAAAVTPEQRQIADKWLKDGGLKDFSQMWPDAQTAAAARDAMLEQKVKEKPATEKAANIGTFEDYVVRAYGPNPTPDQIIAARKKYGQADDRAVKVSVNGGSAAGEALSTGPGGGLESIATQYRLTKKFPPGVARTISKADVNRAINMAAQDDKLLGRSAAASIQKAAMFQANAKAAGQMAVLGAGTEAAESKALGQIDIIKELSPKVWRSSSTGINEWLVNPTQRFTGNKDAQSLANAILTFSSEYSKIINGSVGSVAGASDSARNDAAKLISNALDHGNLMQQLNLMQREMALTRVGYDVAQQHIAEQMQGPQVPGAAPAAGAAPDPASLRQKYKY